eukprot:TRINITY_DN4730_c0_g1_i2.p1 TRINITY_DN4730_c0_g1~~TRINITY_DN4730_c0_g1_i2.p1  ORF type:complete len:311 (-),score=-40.14 TRINITY_DN4730_c0_g1_i2:498-1430(-)
MIFWGTQKCSSLSYLAFVPEPLPTAIFRSLQGKGITTLTQHAEQHMPRAQGLAEVSDAAAEEYLARKKPAKREMCGVPAESVVADLRKKKTAHDIREATLFRALRRAGYIGERVGRGDDRYMQWCINCTHVRKAAFLAGQERCHLHSYSSHSSCFCPHQLMWAVRVMTAPEQQMISEAMSGSAGQTTPVCTGSTKRCGPAITAQERTRGLRVGLYNARGEYSPGVETSLATLRSHCVGAESAGRCRSNRTLLSPHMVHSRAVETAWCAYPAGRKLHSTNITISALRAYNIPTVPSQAAIDEANSHLHAAF